MERKLLQIVVDTQYIALLSILLRKKVILSILGLSNSKGDNQRIVSSFSLQIVGQTWDESYFSNQWDQIEISLKKLLKDKSPDARFYAREAVRAFIQNHPKYGNDFLDQLDSNTRETLAKSEVTVPSKFRRISMHAISVKPPDDISSLSQNASSNFFKRKPKKKLKFRVLQGKLNYQKYPHKKKFLKMIQHLVILFKAKENPNFQLQLQEIEMFLLNLLNNRNKYHQDRILNH